MLISSIEANSAASQDSTLLQILEHCVGGGGGLCAAGIACITALVNQGAPIILLQCCLGCVSCFWFVFLEARKLGLSPLLLLLLPPQHNRATPPNASQICLSCNWMCARNVHQMGGGRRFGCACCLSAWLGGGTAVSVKIVEKGAIFLKKQRIFFQKCWF